MQPTAYLHRPIVDPYEASVRVTERIAYRCLYAFVFVMPWDRAIPLVGGFLISRWLGALTAGATLLYALSRRQLRLPSALHYWMIAFVAWSALSLTWSVSPEDTTARIATAGQLLVMVWTIQELGTTGDRLRGLLQAYVLGTSISAIATIYSFLLGRTVGQMDEVAEQVRASTELRYTVTGFNPNEIALMCVLSVPMALYLLSRSKSRPLVHLYWIQLVLSTTAILLTGSRKALVCVVVAFAMLPMALPHLSRKQRYVALATVAIVLLCAAYVVPQQTWMRLLTIRSNIESGDFGGRGKIWAAGLEVFRQHPFLGVGANAYGASVVKALDIPYYAHSSYISVLVELGVCGEFIFLMFVFSMFYCAAQLPGLERRVWTLLLVTWAVAAITATWEFTRPSWLLFGMLAARVALKPDRRQAAPVARAGYFTPVRQFAGRSHWRQ